jgi:hypothetical protein
MLSKIMDRKQKEISWKKKNRSSFFFEEFFCFQRAVFLMEVFVLAKDREMATEIRCANNLMLPQMVAYLKTAMKPFVGGRAR